MFNYKSEIAKSLSKHIKKKIDENLIEIPPKQELGDFAFPCFPLSKHLKKSPIEIAKSLEKIKLSNKFDKVQASGPYLNFFINKNYLTENTLKKIKSKKSSYGKSTKSKETIVIESPGPNTNKPLHLGHVRNMCLGNALVNLNKTIGNKTVHVDIINDRGIHICKSMLAYKKYGKNKLPSKKSDHFVGDFYVLYAQKSAENELLEKELKQMLVAWENKDKQTRTLWKKMNSWAIKGHKETYKRFGSKIDKAYYESDHYEKGKSIIQKGLKKKIFKYDSDKNIIIDLEKENLGKKVVLRADGTSIYITQDIALADIRYKDFKMNKMVYVVGSEQIHHFKVLFSILEKLGYKFSKNSEHLAYGMIYLPEGKMKSREGTIVDADDLVNKIKESAKKGIKKRKSIKNVDKLAEQIAMAAIKFHILKYDPQKDFTYNPKESISFEGETGPYIQYTTVRINSIINKSKTPITTKIDYTLLNSLQEQKIIKLLSNYQEIIEKATSESKPSILCRYLLDLSQLFNEFYHIHPVISDKKDISKARLLLISSVKQILENGLNLLGIETPEKM